MSNLHVKFLGHAGFLLSKDGSNILIDPLKKGDGDVNGELVYCTHGHLDHTGGVSRFMEKNKDAILLGNKQVIKQFKQYTDRSVTVFHGDSFRLNDWKFHFIESKHGVFSDANLGVIVRNGEDSFGHCGDTISFEGFTKIKVDILAIPITGIVTVSPQKAITELKKFKKPIPQIVVMHWLHRNPRKFCRNLRKEIPNTRCIVLKKGETLQ